MRAKLTIWSTMWLGLSGILCGGAQTYQFEGTNSFIQIHLGTSGALGFAGHEHLIQTAIQQGTFVYDPSNLSKSSVELMVSARELKVRDPGVSLKDKEEIQGTMDSERVLGVTQFPTIRFKSTSVEAKGKDGLLITGNLTIRDKTRPVTVQVLLQEVGSELKATGRSEFKQTDFGIKPVTAGLGTVRVRNLMRIEFQINGHLPQR